MFGGGAGGGCGGPRSPAPSTRPRRRASAALGCLAFVCDAPSQPVQPRRTPSALARKTLATHTSLRWRITIPLVTTPTSTDGLPRLSTTCRVAPPSWRLPYRRVPSSLPHKVKGKTAGVGGERPAAKGRNGGALVRPSAPGRRRQRIQSPDAALLRYWRLHTACRAGQTHARAARASIDAACVV